MSTPIYIVRGNYKLITVRVSELVFASDGGKIVKNYEFSDGDTVKVGLLGTKRYTYIPTISGNDLSFTLSGDVSNGNYGIEVSIVTANGLPLRSFSRCQIKVVETNEEAGLLIDEVDSTPSIASATLSAYEQKVSYDELAQKVDETKAAAGASKASVESSTAKMDAVESGFTSLSAKVEESTQAAKDAKAYVDASSDKMDTVSAIVAAMSEKVDTHTTAINNVTTEVNTTAGKLDSVGEKVDKMDADLAALPKAINDNSAKVDAMVTKVDDGRQASVESKMAVDANTTAVNDIYKYVKNTTEWSKIVSIVQQVPLSQIRFTGSTFSSIPDIVLSDRDTHKDYRNMFESCKYLTEEITTDRLLELFPRIADRDANCSFMFNNCTSLTSVAINHDLTGNIASMFYNCTSLTSVAINHDLTGNMANMFNNCTSLTSVAINHDLTGNMTSMFAGCTSLTSVAINHDLIGVPFANTSGAEISYMFSGCKNLAYFKFGGKVVGYDFSFFYRCDSLKVVDLSGTVLKTSGGIFAIDYGPRNVEKIITDANTLIVNSETMTALVGIDVESLRGILTALCDNASQSKLTLLLNKCLLTTLFGTDYTTNADWTALASIATNKNWTLQIQ